MNLTGSQKDFGPSMSIAHTLSIGLFVHQDSPAQEIEPGRAGGGIWAHVWVDILCSVYFSLPFSEFLLGEHSLHFGLFINPIKIVFLEESQPRK